MTSISVSNLDTLVLEHAKDCDEIIIITGYFSPDMLIEIAKLGKKTKYYYGMYLKNGLSFNNNKWFERIESTYQDFKIYIPISYHVHSKCYLFIKDGIANSALIGSANCSKSGLSSSEYSEMLIPVFEKNDIEYLYNEYRNEIERCSVPYTDPSIVVTPLSTYHKPNKRVKDDHTPSSWNKYSENPFSAIIPLYTMEGSIPVVQPKSGLNWGLQSGHTKTSALYKEALIPITAFVVDHYPTLIPYSGEIGTGIGGKITRRQNPIDVVWDDGTVMKMLFQGNGVERPTKGKRSNNDPYKLYPKNLTSNSGGAELGEYIRKRINVAPNVQIKYSDLIKYGRDYITFSLTNAGNYEIDFHVK